MIHPQKLRDVQQFIEGRMKVIDETDIVTAMAGDGPDAREELEVVLKKLVALQAEPVKPVIEAERLKILVTRYSSIYDKGERAHKADAFESLFRTLRTLHKESIASG